MPFLLPPPVLLGGGGFGPAQTAWSATLNANTNGYENYSIRTRTITLIAGGTQIRVRFKASTAAAMNCDNVSIGVANGATEDTLATPVELLFSGVSGFSISANNTLVSDWANLTTTTSNAVVVIMDMGAANGNPAYVGATTAGAAYSQSATNSYNQQTTSMVANGAGPTGFDLIEVR